MVLKTPNTKPGKYLEKKKTKKKQSKITLKYDKTIDYRFLRQSIHCMAFYSVSANVSSTFHIMSKEGLENLTLTGHMKGKKDRERQ